MSSIRNRQIILECRPQGSIGKSDMRQVESAVPEPSDGEFLVQNEWLSLDPAIRGWMSGGRSYIDPIPVGEVMRGFGAGRIVKSKHSDFPVGTPVTGLLGWQDYTLSDGAVDGKPCRHAPADVPLSAALGVLGLTGQTAYFGLLDIGRPRAGETVLVSAAAGAVGSVVVQIAKLFGCKVIGIAGGAEKCAFVREIGADDCIDYRNDNLKDAIREKCPDGIDIFFDNVGGEILELALRRINVRARIVLCGGISQYNAPNPTGPASYLSLLSNRARMEGFVYFDFADRFDEAETALGSWLKRGLLEHREHVVDGLTRAPEALLGLFDGSNRGKLLIRIRDDAGNIL